MRIVYRGTKEVKADNVAATGLVWTRGQVHKVEEVEKAEKLLAHPLIWADADKPYELLPELKPVPAEPRVHVVPSNSQDTFWDPVVIPVDVEVFKRLQAKELTAVFLTAESVAAFDDWKLERDTRPDSVPQNTGPKPQDLEPTDKRTREWKEWAARNGKAA